MLTMEGKAREKKFEGTPCGEEDKGIKTSDNGGD